MRRKELFKRCSSVGVCVRVAGSLAMVTALTNRKASSIWNPHTEPTAFLFVKSFTIIPTFSFQVALLFIRRGLGIISGFNYFIKCKDEAQLKREGVEKGGGGGDYCQKAESVRHNSTVCLITPRSPIKSPLAKFQSKENKFAI